MKIDISDIIKINGSYVDISLSGNIDGVADAGAELCFKNPVRFKGRLTNLSGVLKLEGILTAEYKAKCYRCLADVHGAVDVDVEETFVNAAEAAGEDEAYVYKGNVIEIDKPLRDNLILNTQMKYVCKEDCKGLCSRCGTNLNESGCCCKEDEINPQMQILKQYFKE